jgi:phosphoribosylformylglycinamidine synthase
VIPGGFAYEDRVRAGAIAAKSRSVDVVREEAARGKLVLGLCNGAQVVAEVGLLGDIAIARNLPSAHFQCRVLDVQLAAPPERCILTAAMAPGTVVKMAMAHGEGRFTGTPELFDRLERQGRITFRFKGSAPNGAMHDAAGVTNEKGNVLALMPHPERVAWNFNLTYERSSLRRGDPCAPSPSHEIFTSMVASLA